MSSLSEDEQRILDEIESHLYVSDPELVREVTETTVYKHALRNIKWAAFGLFLGVVLVVVMLAFFSFVFAFGGFLVMLVSLLFLERNARRIGRAGWEEITRAMRRQGLRGVMGGASSRMRDRFERDGRFNK